MNLTESNPIEKARDLDAEIAAIEAHIAAGKAVANHEALVGSLCMTTRRAPTDAEVARWESLQAAYRSAGDSFAADLAAARKSERMLEGRGY